MLKNWKNIKIILISDHTISNWITFALSRLNISVKALTFFLIDFLFISKANGRGFKTLNSTQHSGHWSFWADGYFNWSCFGVSRFNLKITLVNFRSFCVIYFFWRHVIHPRSFLWISLIVVFLFQSLLVFGLLYLSISLNLNPWLLLIIILPTDTQFMILTIFHNGSLRRWQIISTFII